mmetsp:Transcript_19868/g.46473  ORF Transcript_19868/g.46473 Transcript_19868/m.46473 type:complete len:703 (-) Transcript_19868:47-2155(-)
MQFSPEDVAVKRFMDKGWEEVSTLGRGARGPVLCIRRLSGSGIDEKYALKRSTSDEVAALKALCGRNVVALEEVFLWSNQVLARLECMEGGSFRSYLRAKSPGKVSEDVVRYVIAQVLDGLQDVHRKGWIHRDVKAENIGLSCELTSWDYRNCTVKLLDFDVAAAVPKSGKLTEVIGTVENMAPEVFQGTYNELADIWSVGVITYEALYGYRPFNDANVDRVEEMVRNWQRYLLFPFDAAELPTSFIRLMLTDPEDRSSARFVRSHRWLKSAGHIDSALPATGSVGRHHGHQVGRPDPAKFAAGPRNFEAPRGEATCRSRSQKVMLLGEDSADVEAETSVGWEDDPASGGEEVETLSRLRQGLSIWNRSLTFAPGAAESAAAPLRNGRFIPVSPGSRVESPSQPQADVRPPEPPRKPRAKEPGPAAKDAASGPEQPAPTSQEESVETWHQNYLQRVRDRTQQVIRAAAELSAANAAASAAVSASASAVERPESAESPKVEKPREAAKKSCSLNDEDLDRGAPTDWQRQKSDEKEEIRRQGLAKDAEFNRQLSPSQSLPHVPTLRELERKTAESDASLQHLTSTKSRAQELLKILAQASQKSSQARSKTAELVRPAPAEGEGVTFLPTPPPRPPGTIPAPRRPPTSVAPERVVAAIASAVDRGAVSPPDNSPLSWLAEKKHRMDRLLLGLQSASDDIAVASGS